MVVKYGVMKDGKRTYRQFYCNVIDEKETAMIYQAAVQSLNDFRFPAAFPDWMDGGYATLITEMTKPSRPV